uniref:Uncharacterized protein n=1 Tax=Nelumbo nucifera TaxID=4432 RepID=A0A822YBI4_NELNU|nr:TPA_asm: hypothetical protein HUJ06_030349 [Nelumbo nucifera]
MGNARFLKDVEFGGEELRNVSFDKTVVLQEEKFIYLPDIIIASAQTTIPDTVHEVIPVQDNNEVPSIEQIQQPQEVPLRRSNRQRRSVIQMTILCSS